MDIKYSHHDIEKQPKWVQHLISSFENDMNNLEEEVNLLRQANDLLNDKEMKSNVVEFEQDDYLYMIKNGEIVPVYKLSKGDILLVGKASKSLKAKINKTQKGD